MTGIGCGKLNPAVYLRQAESLLRELEESWERGAAGPVLEQCSSFLRPATHWSYRKLIKKGAAAPAFRRPLLEKLLKLFAQDLRPPQHRSSSLVRHWV
ncbi:hypothetical protein F0U59_29080 [Archangium gephyra]|nr:hypothetical protein F0U59_29080 [Archangium gephyra]